LFSIDQIFEIMLSGLELIVNRLGTGGNDFPRKLWNQTLRVQCASLEHLESRKVMENANFECFNLSEV
jgi:hypothetical protein